MRVVLKIGWDARSGSKPCHSKKHAVNAKRYPIHQQNMQFCFPCYFDSKLFDQWKTIRGIICKAHTIVNGVCICEAQVMWNPRLYSQILLHALFAKPSINKSGFFISAGESQLFLAGKAARGKDKGSLALPLNLIKNKPSFMTPQHQKMHRWTDWPFLSVNLHNSWSKTNRRLRKRRRSRDGLITL